MSEEPVGSLAEEAARLMAVVQGWMGGQGDDAERVGEPARSSSKAEHEHHSGDECRVCPVCQLMRFARAAGPDVRQHLGNAALSMAMAARSLVESLNDDQTDVDEQVDVEKINLSEE